MVYKFNDFSVTEWRRGGSYKKPSKFLVGFCGWGASLGKRIDFVGQYALEFYVVLNNPKYENDFLIALTEKNIKGIKDHVSTPKIAQWHIYQYLLEKFPGLE